MDVRYPDDEPIREDDPSTLSTKEWLKRKRKADYEKAKAAAKAKRREEKAAAAEARAAAQSAKDQALWEALRKGGELDSD